MSRPSTCTHTCPPGPLVAARGRQLGARRTVLAANWHGKERKKGHSKMNVRPGRFPLIWGQKASRLFVDVGGDGDGSFSAAIIGFSGRLQTLRDEERAQQCRGRQRHSSPSPGTSGAGAHARTTTPLRRAAVGAPTSLLLFEEQELPLSLTPHMAPPQSSLTRSPLRVMP